MLCLAFEISLCLSKIDSRERSTHMKYWGWGAGKHIYRIPVPLFEKSINLWNILMHKINLWGKCSVSFSAHETLHSMANLHMFRTWIAKWFMNSGKMHLRCSSLRCKTIRMVRFVLHASILLFKVRETQSSAQIYSVALHINMQSCNYNGGT